MLKRTASRQVSLIVARRIGVTRAVARRLTVGYRTGRLDVIGLLDLETRHDLVVAHHFLFAHDVVALLQLDFGHHLNAFGRVARSRWLAACRVRLAAAALATIRLAHFSFLSFFFCFGLVFFIIKQLFYLLNWEKKTSFFFI